MIPVHSQHVIPVRAGLPGIGVKGRLTVLEILPQFLRRLRSPEIRRDRPVPGPHIGPLRIKRVVQVEDHAAHLLRRPARVCADALVEPAVHRAVREILGQAGRLLSHQQGQYVLRRAGAGLHRQRRAAAIPRVDLNIVILPGGAVPDELHRHGANRPERRREPLRLPQNHRIETDFCLEYFSRADRKSDPRHRRDQVSVKIPEHVDRILRALHKRLHDIVSDLRSVHRKLLRIFHAERIDRAAAILRLDEARKFSSVFPPVIHRHRRPESA